MAHDIVGVAGEAVHGRVVQLAGLLGVGEALLHVGGAVGHGEGEGVVPARRAARLGGLPQPRPSVREPNLPQKLIFRFLLPEPGVLNKLWEKS